MGSTGMGKEDDRNDDELMMLIVLKQAWRTEGWRWRGTVEQTLEQKDWNQWNIFLIAGRIRWLQKKTVGKVFGSGSAEKS